MHWKPLAEARTKSQTAQVDDAELEAGRASARYINSLISGPASPTMPRTRQQSVVVGERRLARFRRFLTRLGNPQDAVRYVHVGGTSGKGSVAAKVAAGLTASGLITGLHCTPYLQTVLEKFECDGCLARPAELAELVGWIRPHVDDFETEDPGGRPTYGMVCVALTLEFFRRRGVDIAVMEVGAGGRFDLTNVVKPELAIVTSVGADHLKSLGGTIENVAWHKAGIFKPGAMAMTGSIPDIARETLRKEAKNIGVSLVEISSSSIDFRETNCELAKAVLSGLHDRGFSISDRSGTVVSQKGLAGRFEQMPDHPVVYLDGAHNRDKAHALAMLLR
ncbi:MAG TPA: Mur ligase family protein, partial [Acidobacteriota bacterium]|nr:Mur ligase family protein [Acidobacteriota bacterium]